MFPVQSGQVRLDQQPVPLHGTGGRCGHGQDRGGAGEHTHSLRKRHQGFILPLSSCKTFEMLSLKYQLHDHAFQSAHTLREMRIRIDLGPL